VGGCLWVCVGVGRTEQMRVSSGPGPCEMVWGGGVGEKGRKTQRLRDPDGGGGGKGIGVVLYVVYLLWACCVVGATWLDFFCNGSFKNFLKEDLLPLLLNLSTHSRAGQSTHTHTLGQSPGVVLCTPISSLYQDRHYRLGMSFLP